MPYSHASAADPALLDGWDILAGPHSFYASVPWLTFVDSDKVAEPAYWIEQEDGRTLAGLIVNANPDENHGAYRSDRVLPDGSRIPLTVGGRRGFRSAALVADSSGGSVERLARLITAAVGDRRWWWPYLPTPDAEIVRQATARPGLHLVDAECEVELPGHSIDDLIASLPNSERRNAMRREQKRFDRTGMRMSRRAFSDCWRELVPLLANVEEKYGSTLSTQRRIASLQRQVDALDDCAIVFTCHDGDDLVGFSVAYATGDELAMRLVGFDYGRIRGVGDEYAQVLVHEPLRYCYERGIRRLNLGADGYPAKCRRGGRVIPLWAVVPGMITDRAAITAEAERIASTMPGRESSYFLSDVSETVARWIAS